ncbi:MAG: phosphatidylserine/phosphatidylglycerophosphate/cardiolipin synthase family protein [Acidobacteriota bacterium]
MAAPFVLLVLAAILTGSASRAAAADVLCDPAVDDCRAPLIQLIRDETVGIDVAFWFMEDARYTAELTKKAQEGVPIRVLVDPRANVPNPFNADRLAELQQAGIPMRQRTASGILHWKAMIFSGQNTVEFSAANYSADAFAPVTPYDNYVDEVIVFSSDATVVQSFMTKYDDLWTDISGFANYANVTGGLVRSYSVFPTDPELNFSPAQNFRSRAVARYDAESQGIDVIMYRVTDPAHADAMIRAVQRGVPVRLITEPQQYRDPIRYWHSYNIDRMYAAGIQVRERAHAGLTHQKSVLLRGQQLTIFGSSNWTSPSADRQEEHNYFTSKPDFFQFFSDQFDRKWNNLSGHAETQPFTPAPPDRPEMRSPADLAQNLDTGSVTLTWNGGLWAHNYDVYFGTAADPPLVASDLPLGPSKYSSVLQRFQVSSLLPGTTYYWRIVSKTMASMAASGPTYAFTTAGFAPPPPPTEGPGPGDVVLYAADAPVVRGAWRVLSDASAARSARLGIPDAGRAKVTTAFADPADYFEMTFTAEAGRPYRLWLRLQAQDDYWANDSVHVQFSQSVDAAGAPAWRIGTTGSAEVNLEDAKSAGVSGWGWQDNGYGRFVLGPAIYFATTGPQTIRVQRREDGASIDQIVLSPEKFLSAAPGGLTNDATILSDTAGPPPPPPAADTVVIHAASVPVAAGAWMLSSDATAAGGARLGTPDRSGAKVTTALADPADYVEVTFTASAGRPYHLWLRGRAEGDYWANDSVHAQFSGSVDAGGAPVARIGTSDSLVVNLEDCSRCGEEGWGWQDNGYGAGVFGPDVYFEAAGTQTLRIQVREDGFSIDQIVLSPSTYLTSSPGALKRDTTILAPSSGEPH